MFDKVAFPHARVTTAHVRSGAADEVRRGWASLLEVYASSGAFGGLLSLHDDEADVAVTVTLWSSSEAADQAAEQLRPLALAAFGELLLSPPHIAKYNVLLQGMAVPEEGR